MSRLQALHPVRPMKPRRNPNASRSPAGLERLALYRSKEWRKARAEFLRANPRCIACGAQATVVDHIHGHGGDWRSRFWRRDLWQAMCWPCHSPKSAKEGAARPRRSWFQPGPDPRRAQFVPTGSAPRLTHGRTCKTGGGGEVFKPVGTAATAPGGLTPTANYPDDPRRVLAASLIERFRRNRPCANRP